MRHYHNRLDKKYFHKSVYIKKWEETFNVKIKDYPLQYELVFETYNTLLKYNNILFSKNYIAKSKKVDKLINLLNEYLHASIIDEDYTPISATDDVSLDSLEQTLINASNAFFAHYKTLEPTENTPKKKITN